MVGRIAQRRPERRVAPDPRVVKRMQDARRGPAAQSLADHRDVEERAEEPPLCLVPEPGGRRLCAPIRGGTAWGVAEPRRPVARHDQASPPGQPPIDAGAQPDASRELLAAVEAADARRVIRIRRTIRGCSSHGPRSGAAALRAFPGAAPAAASATSASRRAGRRRGRGAARSFAGCRRRSRGARARSAGPPPPRSFRGRGGCSGSGLASGASMTSIASASTARMTRAMASSCRALLTSWRDDRSSKRSGVPSSNSRSNPSMFGVAIRKPLTRYFPVSAPRRG